MKRFKLMFVSNCLLIAALLTFFACSEEVKKEKPKKMQFQTKKIAKNLYVVFGGGGNTCVLTGKDGVLVVDTTVPEAKKKFQKVLAKISSKPVRYLINTHWHYDHVGGNDIMAKAGARIIAHKNVKKRMSKEQYIEFFKKKVPPAPKEALPTKMVKKKLTLKFNNEKVDILHFGPGHTDGDVVVYFRKANVIHLGDLYFAGIYPYVGVSSGGSIKYIPEVLTKIMNKINSKTIIIPGHGPIMTKANFAKYIKMLKSIRKKISSKIKTEKTLKQIIKSKPTKKFDKKYGNGFIPADQFVGLVYKDLIRFK